MPGGGGLQVPGGVPGMFPAPNSAQRVGGSSREGGASNDKVRAKVPLQKGRSLMDWIRLMNERGPALNGIGGRKMRVTMEELAKHNTREDAWMAVNGVVYNVTEYMEFHPGGEGKLMEGVGTDATALFNRYHSWVNPQTMLEKTIVGPLVAPPAMHLAAPGNAGSGGGPVTLGVPGTPSAAVPRRAGSAIAQTTDKKALPQKLRTDWYQTEKEVFLNVYVPNLSPKALAAAGGADGKEVVLTISEVVHGHKHQVAVRLGGLLRFNTAEQPVLHFGPKKLEVRLLKDNTGQWPSDDIKVTTATEATTVVAPDSNSSTVSKVTKRGSDFTVKGCVISEIKDINGRGLMTYVIDLPADPQIDRVIGDWEPGQHLYLSFPQSYRTGYEGADDRRPYTPSAFARKNGTHWQAVLDIKLYPDGVFTGPNGPLQKHSQVPGEMCQIRGPAGHKASAWLDDAKGQAITLLAAGTGITPLISVLRAHLGFSPWTHVTTDTAAGGEFTGSCSSAALIYSVRQWNDVLEWEEIQVILGLVGPQRLRVHVIITDGPVPKHPELSEGISISNEKLDVESLRALVKVSKYANSSGDVAMGPADPHYFVCGPLSYNRSMDSKIRGIEGQDTRNIHLYQ
eukprot:Clim_evm89s243 gene=Clim_evmTU89s243